MDCCSPDSKEHVSVNADPSMIEHRVVSPVSTGHIIGGAAIFTDMTETISSKAQKPEGSLTDNVLTPGQIVGSSNEGEFKTRSQTTHDTKDIYPELYLPLAENYRISDRL